MLIYSVFVCFFFCFSNFVHPEFLFSYLIVNVYTYYRLVVVHDIHPIQLDLVNIRTWLVNDDSQRIHFFLNRIIAITQLHYTMRASIYRKRKKRRQTLLFGKDVIIIGVVVLCCCWF